MNKKWYEIIIEEPNHLPGSSIYEVIVAISKILSCKYIVIDYMQGAIPEQLFEMECKIKPLSEVLHLFLEADQICFGEFFLFKEYPQNWINREGDKSHFLIAQTTTTVRAFDQTSIYIYTPYQEVFKFLLEKYPIESHQFDYLENYVYPG